MRYIKVNPQLGWLESLEGAQLLERRLAVTANNLANVDTPGFKKDIVSFREVLMQKILGGWRTFKEVTLKTDFQQAGLEFTGRPFDIAIGGEGFFKVQTPAGVAYTRAGNFRLDSQRRLVTPEGYPVLADGIPIIIDPGLVKGGAITLDDARFLVSSDGTISIDGTEIARLDIVTFNDLSLLKKYGQNLFIPERGAEEIPVDNPELRQGYLEESNVNTLGEMIDLIEINREFEAAQRAIKTQDEIDRHVIETYGRV